jgi:ADP-ribosylglycohydrolase
MVISSLVGCLVQLRLLDHRCSPAQRRARTRGSNDYAGEFSGSDNEAIFGLMTTKTQLPSSLLGPARLRVTARQRIAEIGPVRRSRALPSMKADSGHLCLGRSHMRAIFLLSAFGDSMGNLVDNDSLDDIFRKYGAHGVSAPPNPGEITSGTQLMLFTADALIRNILAKGTVDGAIAHMRLAYVRWLRTQKIGEQAGRLSKLELSDPALGWLAAVPQLHNLRPSEVSVVASLRAGANATIEKPINASASGAALQRVSPIGLVYEPRDSFLVAARCAAITNGHPVAIYSAGVFSYLVSALARGHSFPLSIESIVGKCRSLPEAHLVVTALRSATKLAAKHPAQLEVVEDLIGRGNAHEVLAVATYCVFSEPQLQRACWALALATNQSGPSSSSAAVTGALLGAWHGAPAINRRWLSRMELVRTIVQVADDLSDCRNDNFDTLDQSDYPFQ